MSKLNRYWYSSHMRAAETHVGMRNHLSQEPLLLSYAKLKWFVCFVAYTSHVNSYGHCATRTVSSPDHTFFLGKLEQVVNQYFVPILSLVYSVQIRDVGRSLAKFNPWTNTFRNRLLRSHCLRIHPSVKLSTPISYT